MSDEPSPQQLAVWQAMLGSKEHVLVEASPGSGKTTTAVYGVVQLPYAAGPVLCVAFNVEIKDALTQTFGQLLAPASRGGGYVTKSGAHVRVQTVSALGYGLLMDYYPHLRSTRADRRRTRDILTASLEAQSCKVTRPHIAASARLLDLAKATLTDRAPPLAVLAEEHRLPSSSLSAKAMGAVVEHALALTLETVEHGGALFKTGGYDFADLVWLPLMLDCVRRSYRTVVVDEVQDLDAAQTALILKVGERLVGFGDAHQCHPPGVLITTADGAKPVETLQEERDLVRPWDRKSQRTVKPRKFEMAARPYLGDLIEVEAGGRAVPVTPNHRFVARWTSRTIDSTCTYLMWRADRGYRVGWCKLFSQNDNGSPFHFAQRARLERADKAWILRTFKGRTDASVYESQVAIRYGIPTAMFEPMHGASHMTEEALVRIFATISPEEHARRGRRVLKDHGRLDDQPLYPWPSQAFAGARQGRRTYFEVHASNLEPELMSIPLPDDVNVWAQVASCSRRHYEGPVYSLNVEEHHSYIANGLVTLNSLYGFRGAGADSMKDFARTTCAVTLPLSTSYRCASLICKEASRYGRIEPAAGAPQGMVESVSSTSYIPLVRRGDYVLGRTNTSVIDAFRELRAEGLEARLAIDPVIAQRAVEALSALPSFAAVSKWLGPGPKPDDPHGDDEEDAAKALVRAFLPMHRDLSGLITDLRNHGGGKSPERDQTEYVWCATTHRAKGLEAHRVFVLWASYFGAEDNREVSNLKFVALTRARSTLFIVRSPERAAPSEDDAEDDLERALTASVRSPHARSPRPPPRSPKRRPVKA